MLRNNYLITDSNRLVHILVPRNGIRQKPAEIGPFSNSPPTGSLYLACESPIITTDFLTNLERPAYFPPITIARTFSEADTLL